MPVIKYDLPTAGQRLVISITQTSDEDSDLTCLRRLFDVLKEFSGEDEVILRVKTEEKVNSLKLTSTRYCPEFHQRLVELVGDDCLKLEPITV